MLCLCGCGLVPKRGRRFASRSCCFNLINRAKIETKKPEPTRESILCLCGCGGLTEAGHKYLSPGHAHRHRCSEYKLLLDPSPEFPCSCGCGRLVKPGNKWATSGCHSRGKALDPEIIARMVATRLRNLEDPSVRTRHSERIRELHKNKEFRIAYLVGMKRYRDNEEAQKYRIAQLREAFQRPEVQARRSVVSKARWEDSVQREKYLEVFRRANSAPSRRESRRRAAEVLWRSRDFRETMARARSGGSKPSRLHLSIKEALGKQGFVTQTHVPIDFYVVDEANPELKIVIEIQGCYWHGCSVCHPERGSSWHDRAKRTYLSNRGWVLIEIWEHEWKQDPEGCLKRVRDIWNQGG